MKIIIQICLLTLSFSSYGQRYEYVYKNPMDSSFNCYLKVIPETENIRGLVIRDYTHLPDTSKKSPYQLTKLCIEAELMTLYTSTSLQFPELFTSDSIMERLDDIIVEVVNEYNIPKNNIFIGGMSSSGTRALRYAQYCAQGKSTIIIKGVFVVDSPLDLERFYISAKEHKKNFKEGMLWEANWMLPLFHKLFKGGPDEFYDDYKSASVFSHTDSLGGNAVLLKNTDIIMFHEPDIDWWLTKRGASYYDFNSYDIAAFALQLEMLGNKNVELITTTGKGFDQKGNRNCHSWTIVDEEYLANWIKERLE